jgi:hypothetical protein
MARKDFGSNDGPLLIAMTHLRCPRVPHERTVYYYILS